MLSGVNEDGKLIPYPLGHFFIAIDTEAFMGLDTFKKISGDILRELRNSTLAPGENKIYTAGEKEYLAWLERKDLGIPLNEGIIKDLKEVKEMLKVDIDLPF